ncbi:hypothetical protein VTH82DRAFT_6903 [Thermothelomyces myriococcoides]
MPPRFRIETKPRSRFFWSREEDDEKDAIKPNLFARRDSLRENRTSPYGPRIEDKLRILMSRSAKRAEQERTDRSRSFSLYTDLSDGDGLESGEPKFDEVTVERGEELGSIDFLDGDADSPVFYSFGDMASKEDEEGYLTVSTASDEDSSVTMAEEHSQASQSPLPPQPPPPPPPPPTTTTTTTTTTTQQQQQGSPPGGGQRGPAAYHVIESLYAGDGYEGGHHSVKLTAVRSERATISHSMFRWM